MYLKTLATDLHAFELNRHETVFLHQEIFVDQTYCQNGITISKGATVLDVGANIGLFSIYAARAAAEVSVYAFEPIAEVHQVLAANFSFHNIGGAALAVAVTDFNGPMTLQHYPQMTMMSGRHTDPERDAQTIGSALAGARSRLPPWVDHAVKRALKPEERVCQAHTLSSLMVQLNLTRVDLLKVDVEREELAVLSGINDAHWPGIQQVVAEVHDEGGRLAQVCGLLERQGMTVVCKTCGYGGDINVMVYARRL